MDKISETSADVQALSALFQQMIDGWNQGNGQAYAAPFTEDADYVIVDGKHVKGREVIAFGHQYIFETVFRGSTMKGQVEDIRFLSVDIALMHESLYPGRPHTSWRTPCPADVSLHTYA